jgi:hypothetical protein
VFDDHGDDTVVLLVGFETGGVVARPGLGDGGEGEQLVQERVVIRVKPSEGDP